MAKNYEEEKDEEEEAPSQSYCTLLFALCFIIAVFGPVVIVMGMSNMTFKDQAENYTFESSILDLWIVSSFVNVAVYAAMTYLSPYHCRLCAYAALLIAVVFFLVKGIVFVNFDKSMIASVFVLLLICSMLPIFAALSVHNNETNGSKHGRKYESLTNPLVEEGVVQSSGGKDGKEEDKTKQHATFGRLLSWGKTPRVV